jgi:hypothetical protein
VEVNEDLETTDLARIPTLTSQVWNDVLSYVNTNVISSSTTGALYNSISFMASQFSNFADYQNVFDQYRILKVEAIFRPQANSQVTNVQNPGELTIVIDLDDANVPTALTQLQQYATQITKPGYKKIRRCFKPHCALAAYGGGAFTSYANVKDQWLDVANSGIQHYGLKTGWSTTSVVYAYDMTVRASFQFRSSR